MSLFFKPKTFLGVDLGAGGVKMLELKLEKHRPVLNTFGYTSVADKTAVPIDNFFKVMSNTTLLGQKKSLENNNAVNSGFYFSPEQVKERADILKEVYHACKATAKSAVVSLPSSAVFHTIVTIPQTSKEEFSSILKAEIKKLLPIPLEETMIDYQILDAAKDAKEQRVLVNAVPRALVVFYSQIFQRAGIKLQALEPESTSLTRALIGRDTSVTMVIDMGAERTNFFIADQSIPVTHHSVELGGSKISETLRDLLGVDNDWVDQIKYDLSYFLESYQEKQFTAQEFMQIFRSLVDPIAKEIQYSFDLYLSQLGNESKRPEKIILTGGASFLPFLSQYLSEQFKIKCYMGDPWSRVIYQEDLKPVLSKIGPRMASVVGLALRSVV